MQSDILTGKTDCPNISVELVTFRLYFCEVLNLNPETFFSDWGSWFSSVPLWNWGDAGCAGNSTTITSLHVLSNSSFGKAVRLLAGRTGIRIPTGQGVSLLQNVQPDSEAHPVFIEWVPRFFTGVKRPWREVNTSPTSSAAVKNEWRYTSASPICLHGVGKENDTFTVT